ncbi:MAG: hypothetical protein JNG88_16340 [Phycisphaerales bacterium]|nr:hypothetical protein [Phycisphaerales bacterium]
MNAWTYYSPMWGGALAAGVVYYNILGTVPPGWRVLGWLACLVVALICQMLMIGAQGAFGQVLPVIGGKSIRGSGAILCGTLLLAGTGLALVGLVLTYEAVTLGGRAVFILGGASLTAALAAYFWNIPAAVRDFADEK